MECDYIVPKIYLAGYYLGDSIQKGGCVFQAILLKRVRYSGGSIFRRSCSGLGWKRRVTPLRGIPPALSAWFTIVTSHNNNTRKRYSVGRANAGST